MAESAGHNVRRSRVTAVLIPCIIGATLLPGSPAAAQEVAAVTASASPAMAQAGAAVTVSGTGCLRDGTPGSLTFGFAAVVSASGVDLTPLDDSHAGPDGTWSVTISIPTHIRSASGERFEVEPGPDYEISAMCAFPETPSDQWLHYPPIPFEVMAPTPASASSSPDTPAPPGAPAAATPLDATPAPPKPIVGEPPFTG